MTDGIALITHVTHFVGPASAKALNARGLKVFCHDESFTEAGPRERFAAANPSLTALAEQTPEDLVSAVEQAAGRLDVLVNNDSYPALRAPVEEAKAEDFRATLEGLMVFPFLLAGRAAALMKRQGQGRILFVSSAAPLRGIPNYSMYAAARGGANALALSLAKELAPHKILVNAIAPNYVESPTYFPESLLADPAARAKMERNIPLGRLGKPEEVASLVAFFAAGDCGFATGQVVSVSGGWA